MDREMDVTTIYVGPVTHYLIQRTAAEMPSELASLIEGIECSIERKESDQTARSYNFPLKSGDSAKISCSGQDGLTILHGQVKAQDLSFEVSDDLIWMKGLPRAAVESYRSKAASWELRVKDIVAFLPQDSRNLVDAVNLSDEHRTWFQIKYNQASIVQTWPTWESIRGAP